MEEQAEENNVTVGNFSPQRNESDNIINKVANLTINDVRNNLINKVSKLTINDVRNDRINKVENLTIKGVGNDSN